MKKSKNLSVLGAIPIEGGAHEVATLCVGKINVGRAAAGVPLCQSCPVVCGGMSYIAVSYTTTSTSRSAMPLLSPVMDYSSSSVVCDSRRGPSLRGPSGSSSTVLVQSTCIACGPSWARAHRKEETSTAEYSTDSQSRPHRDSWLPRMLNTLDWSKES